MKETQHVTALSVVHATVVAILILLFLWPAGSAEPRNLPIGLVGPNQQTSQIASMVDQQQPDAVEFTGYSSREEAEAAIANKEIYGAIVLGPQPEALIATAANPNVAQFIRDLGGNLMNMSAQQQGMQVPQLKVTELAALAEADQRGAVLGSSALPIVIGGISLGALAILRLKTGSGRIALVSIASLFTGAIAAATISGVFGALPGDYFMNTLALAAILAAIGFALIGAHAVAGMVGFGLTAATLFLIGNPLNGVALPAEFYPGIWGAIGQLMPVGSGFELLKRINYFELSDQSAQWWVLVAWISIGFLLALFALRKKA